LTTDQITVVDWLANTSGQYQIERVEFADGTVWGAAALTANALVVTGTVGDDALSGTVLADTLRGMQGNDTLTAVGYGDTLDGGDGTRVLSTTGSGHDSLDWLYTLSSDRARLREQSRMSDGQTTMAQEVQGLIHAMAMFSAPAIGESSGSATFQDSFPPLAATSWG